MKGPEGVVNLLKPPGMTASNAVSDVRRIFHEKRVGHTGTLDPGAAGVLPICIGRATRLFDLLVDKEKEYIAEIRFGARTDTQDAYGAIVARSGADVSREELSAILPSFLGTQEQIPPMYSALKRGGERLHRLARQGQEIEREARTISVHALELLDEVVSGGYLLRVRCSRGTYVRTLCEDIGARLGRCAYMAFLLRTEAGPFRLAEAYSIAELAALEEAGRLSEALIPIEQALAFLPALTIDPDTAARLRNGVSIPQGGEAPMLSRLYAGERFLGVGERTGDLLRLKLHLYEHESEEETHER